MIMRLDRLIELPNTGRLIIITDIHGNWDDWYFYTRKVWNKEDKDCHILFTGDFIHNLDYGNDMSLDILDEIDKFYNLPNFHVILGNHELMQIQGIDVYKDGVNQTKDFVRHIEDRSEWNEEVFMTEIMYQETMKAYPWFARTQNGIFIMHAGPDSLSILDLEKDNETLLTMDTTKWNERAIDILESFVWARPWDDYTPSIVDSFLETVSCHTMIVGHTPVQYGYGVFGSQIILSSSYGADENRKSYIDIPLDADVKNIDDVLKYIKRMEA